MYNVFVFEGSFTDIGNPDMNRLACENMPPDDARKLVEVALKYGLDVAIRRVEPACKAPES